MTWSENGISVKDRFPEPGTKFCSEFTNGITVKYGISYRDYAGDYKFVPDPLYWRLNRWIPYPKEERF